MSWRRTQQIAVDGEHDVCCVKQRRCLHRRSIGELAALAYIRARDRLPVKPTRFRINVVEGVELCNERWRGDGAREHDEALAVILRKNVALLRNGAREAFSTPGQARTRDFPFALRVVEIEHLRLGEDVRRAEARRMVWIALDLDRATHPVLDHDARRIS